MNDDNQEPARQKSRISLSDITPDILARSRVKSGRADSFNRPSRQLVGCSFQSENKPINRQATLTPTTSLKGSLFQGATDLLEASKRR